MKNILLAILIFSVFPAKSQETQKPVLIRVDAKMPIGEMTPFWSYFGYDEPNYTTGKDGMKLLTELEHLSSATVFVRTHNLLASKGNSQGLTSNGVLLMRIKGDNYK